MQKRYEKTAESVAKNKLTRSFNSSVKSLGLKFGAIATAVVGMGKALGSSIDEAIDLIEATNLFEVQLGKVTDEYGNLDESASKYYTDAIKFQKEMSEQLGVNTKELMEQQAMFFNLLSSQGIDKATSSMMSESLTKASYDLASLFNLEVSDAMQKLQSGIAGEVKGLRKLGIDISESALQGVLEQAGVDKTVQQLSYAEKEVARYIAILNQAGEAQGDFAKTFNSPANQIKLFKEQVIQLKQVIGSFFTNLFGNALVYINGFLMAVKETLKAIGSIFGWTIEYESDGGISSAVGTDELTDGLNSATGSAKKLKKELMGFDEINNITLPTSSGSGGGSSSTVSGIDSKLINSLKEWENKMTDVNNRARDIRDNIMEWLGFTKQVDDATGEVTWKLNEGYTNLKLIEDIAKAIGVAFLSWKAVGIATDIQKTYTLLAELKGTKMIEEIGKKLNAFVGLAVTITSMWFYTEGISGIANGELTAEKIIKAIGGGLGLGYGIWKLTGKSKLAIIITAITVSFAIGTSIGEWIKQNYGDSIDWYIDKVNLDFNKDNFLQQAGKIAVIILGTIGDVIIDLITKAGTWIDENIVTPITKHFYNKFPPAIKLIFEKIMLDVAKFVENIPFVGQSIATSIRQTVVKYSDTIQEGIKKSTTNAIENAQPEINEKAKESAEEYIETTQETIEGKTQELSNSISNTVENSTKKSTPNIEGFAKVLAINYFNKLDKTTMSQEQKDSLKLSIMDLVKKASENSTGSAQGDATRLANNITKAINGTVSDDTTRMVLSRTLSSTMQETINKASEKAKEQSPKIAKSTASGFSSTLISGVQQLSNVVSSVVNVALSKADTSGSSNIGSNVIWGIIKGMNNNKSALWSTITSIGKGIISAFTGTKSLDIHSPSRKMRDKVGKFIPLGIAEGIDENAKYVYSSIEDMSKGITVATKNNSLDSFIDYGTLNGNINTQATVSTNSGLVTGIATAVSNALRTNPIDVKIEAKTEEGVIVEKVSQGFNEYVMQTGELPFAIPY